MKRLMLLLLTGLVALSCAFMLGCEEDAAVTGESEQTTLTEDDSMMAEEILSEDILTSPLNALNLSWDLVDHIPGEGASRFQGSPLVLEGGDEEMTITDAGYEGYGGGWHIFNFAAIAVEHYTYDEVQYYDTVFITGVDSIQVIVDGEPIQYPNDQAVLDGLNQHAHIGWNSSDSDHTGSLNHLIETEMEYSEAGTVITINGSTDDELTSSENRDWGACDITIGTEQTITNLVFNMNAESECPEAGAISSTSTIDASCIGLGANAGDTLEVNSTWTVTATINEGAGTMTVTFTNGAVSWTVTEPCEEGGHQGSSGWNK